MVWEIEYTNHAAKAIRRLDKPVAALVLDKLEEAAKLDDPTTTAKPMTNNLKGLWSWRIAGGYRILGDVQGNKMVILVLEANTRDKVYKYEP